MGLTEIDELDSDGFGGDLFEKLSEGFENVSLLTFQSHGEKDLLGAYLYSSFLDVLAQNSKDLESAMMLELLSLHEKGE